MPTNHLTLSEKIKYNIYDKIMSAKCNNKQISSVSIPHADFYILAKDINFQRECDLKNPTIMGIKIKCSNKVLRINLKWDENRKIRKMFGMKYMMNPSKYFIPMDLNYNSV